MGWLNWFGPRKPSWAKHSELDVKAAQALLGQVQTYVAGHGATSRLEGDNLIVTTRDGETAPVDLSLLAILCGLEGFNNPDGWAKQIEGQFADILPSESLLQEVRDNAADWEADHRDALLPYEDWEYARRHLIIGLLYAPELRYPPPGMVYLTAPVLPDTVVVARYDVDRRKPSWGGLYARHLSGWITRESDVLEQAIANAAEEAASEPWTSFELLPGVTGLQCAPASEAAVASALLDVGTWADKDAPGGTLFAIPRTNVLLTYRPRRGDNVRQAVEALLGRVMALHNDESEDLPGMMLTDSLFFHYDGKTESMEVLDNTDEEEPTPPPGMSRFDVTASPTFSRLHLNGKSWDDSPY